MATKYLDYAGLEHLVQKLYDRGFKGMGLSQENFTTALLNKLNSTATTEGMAEINTRLSALEALIEADSDGAINKFNEIVAFLNGIGDSSTLEGVLAGKANADDVYTKGQADAKFATPESVQTALDPYAKTVDVNTSLANKLDTLTFNTEIGKKADKATTLAGYGIADAKIAEGTITLGYQTLTPLTEHQDISGKVDKVPGKGLSTNDYSDMDKAAVATIADKLDAADVVAITITEIDVLINAETGD